jgi:hypothetical protein
MAHILTGIVNILLFLVPVPLLAWADQSKARRPTPNAAAGI